MAGQAKQIISGKCSQEGRWGGEGREGKVGPSCVTNAINAKKGLANK